ncbi:MAG: DUF6941 family protein [Solirubrobacteraceae bacterium]
MRVDWAIPCRYAEVHDNLATIIGGGIDHMWMPALPAPVQVILAIRLIFLPDEIDSGAVHKLRVAAIAPGGETLSQVEGDLNVAGPTAPAGDWLQGLHIPMAIQFMAEAEGQYSLEITVDGHTMGVFMNVALGPPPQPPSG